MKRILLLCLLMLYTFQGAAQQKLEFAVSQKNYILLIDSSASMSVFDPKKLRQSSVRLFSILAPKKSMVGLYQFSSSVEELIPIQPVNSVVRNNIETSSRKIHSVGAVSNLNNALDVLSIKLAKITGEHHIILITDGDLDSGLENIRTKMIAEKLESKTLPNLSKHKIHVHVISPTSDHADLLKKITYRTSGIYQSLAYADELSKKLVYIFDRTHYNAYQINMKSMSFDVRDRAKEASIIINDSDAKVILIDPEGNEYKESTVPSYIKWKRDYGYQSINIKLPIAGRWQLKSKRELDNRVVIFDDFKLEVSDIPHHLFMKEQLLLNVALLMNGEIVRSPNLSKYLKFQVIDSIDGSKRTFNLSANRSNGVYQGSLTLDKTGQHNLTIQVTSPAFKRSVTKTVYVYESPVKFELRRDFNSKMHEVVVKPYSKILAPDQTKIEAIIELNNKKQIESLLYNKKEGQWTIKLKEIPAGQAYAIHLRVNGQDEVGRPFHVLTKPFIVYSSLAQKIDYSTVDPGKLPQHLPLVYRFDLVSKKFISELAYPLPQIENKKKVNSSVDSEPKRDNEKEFVEFDEIEVENPAAVFMLGSVFMFFLIILLFLYMRQKNIVSTKVYADLYELLSLENMAKENS